MCTYEEIFNIIGILLESLRRCGIVLHVGLDEEERVLVLTVDIFKVNGSWVGLSRCKTDSDTKRFRTSSLSLLRPKLMYRH